MPETLTAALVVEQLWHAVPGGSGTYVRELAAALLDEPTVRPFGVTARHRTAAPHWAAPAELPLVESALPRPVLYESWNRWRRARTAHRVPHIDVVHATTWAIPPASEPLVVTVHDLAFLEGPQHFTRHGAGWFRRAMDVTRSEAAFVVAVSRATRDACLAQGFEPDRVVVVPHGVRVPTVDPDAVAGLRRRLGVDRPYLFWCGTIEPRKNVARLVRAFGAACRAGLGLDLVLAGPRGWGSEADRVRAAVEDAPAGRVHQLGELSFHDLHAAYAGAAAFVFPSLREGFGMPVLEAMAHGLPVLTSVGTAMAEVGGDAVVLVDPTDDDALADGMSTVTSARHDELSARSLVRAAGFTWSACAAATADVYRRAVAV